MIKSRWQNVHPFLTFMTFLVIILAGLSANGSASGNLLTGMVCGKDLDGDGAFGSKGEIVSCENGVCPHDTVECEASYSAPECPAGYVYLPGRNRCESAPSCPGTAAYHEISDKCSELSNSYRALLAGNGTSTSIAVDDWWWNGTFEISISGTFIRYCDSGWPGCGAWIPLQPDSVSTSQNGQFRIQTENDSIKIDFFHKDTGWQNGNWANYFTGRATSTWWGRQLEINNMRIKAVPDGDWIQLSLSCLNGGILEGPKCNVYAESTPVCPYGGVLDTANDVCWVNPTCPDGKFQADLHRCNDGNNTCPLGKYLCADIDRSGIKKCSSSPCMDLSAPGSIEEESAVVADYRDDGTIDPGTGQCSGVFKIFNGKSGECLPSGIKTTFFNCCDSSPSSWLLFNKACPDESLRTAQAIEANVTHYVGSYCKEKIKFIGCVQKARVYCRFNSKLARIVHQQGRQQLIKFGASGGWGAPEAPNCEGFTPEEFQMLDFAKIDLSEFFGDINPAATSAVQQQAQDAVLDFQRQLR